MNSVIQKVIRFLDAGNCAAAIELLSDPKVALPLPEKLFWLGKVYLLNGDAAQAALTLEKVLKAEAPKGLQIEARLVLAGLLIADSRYQSAYEHLRAAINEGANNPEVDLMTAECFIRLGELASFSDLDRTLDLKFATNPIRLLQVRINWYHALAGLGRPAQFFSLTGQVANTQDVDLIRAYLRLGLELDLGLFCKSLQDIKKAFTTPTLFFDVQLSMRGYLGEVDKGESAEELATLTQSELAELVTDAQRYEKWNWVELLINVNGYLETLPGIERERLRCRILDGKGKSAEALNLHKSYFALNDTQIIVERISYLTNTGDYQEADELSRLVDVKNLTRIQKYNISLMLLKAKLYKEAWRLYRHRYDIEKLPSAKVYLHQRELYYLEEQGIGDQLIFLRFAHKLCQVTEKLTTVYVQERNLPLFQALDTNIEFRSTREFKSNPHRLVAPLAEASSHYFYLKLDQQFGEVPDLLGAKLGQSSAMSLEADYSVGISWRSSALRNSSLKSVEIEDALAYILHKKYRRVVNLNFEDKDDDQLTKLRELGIPIGPARQWNEIENLITDISNISQYVGISSTYAHIAAVMKKPTTVLIPNARAELWYWSSYKQKVGHTDWYPGAEIKRPPFRAV